MLHKAFVSYGMPLPADLFPPEKMTMRHVLIPPIQTALMAQMALMAHIPQGHRAARIARIYARRLQRPTRMAVPHCAVRVVDGCSALCRVPRPQN